MAKFIKYIEKNIDEYKEQIIDNNFLKTNINNIFENGDLDKESILVVGEVQSGKTKNIIECIEYAINHGYDIVIVFAGTTNLLLGQSKGRFINELYSKKVNAEIASFDKNSYLKINNYIEKNKPFILPILKGNVKLLELFNTINDSNLSNKKVLIIDDECDFGSINVAKSKSNSELYDKISKLYSRISYGKLLSFTATPFSNILSDSTLYTKPDRIVSLITYSDYCGLQKFNESNCYLTINDDKNDYDDKTLKHAITCWLLSTSIMMLDYDNNFYDGNLKSQFLVNICYENKEQNQILKDIKYGFKNFFENDFINFENWVNDKLIEIGFDDCYYSPKEIKDKIVLIYKSISKNENNCFIPLYGSQNDDVKKFNENNEQFTIIVSGFMASRGITFENLICELFLNSSNNEARIDSLLQKCRWFGNRKKTIKYMRILLNEKIKKQLYYAYEYIKVFGKGKIYSLVELKDILTDLDSKSRKNNWKVISTENGKRK